MDAPAAVAPGMRETMAAVPAPVGPPPKRGLFAPVVFDELEKEHQSKRAQGNLARTLLQVQAKPVAAPRPKAPPKPKAKAPPKEVASPGTCWGVAGFFVCFV